MVVIDHGRSFEKDATSIFALGDAGGARGGRLIDAQDYIKGLRLAIAPKRLPAEQEVRVFAENEVYGYRGVDLRLPDKGAVLITGRSGVGKSILLREYLPLCFDSYQYISQQLLHGGKYSFVATALDVAGVISECYARRFSKAKTYFSRQFGCEGACQTCGGGGALELSSEIGHSVVCADCNGSGFNPRLDKFKISGWSIIDLWNLTIEDVIDPLKKIGMKNLSVLEDAKSLLLGHLTLGQQTKTLSGGENIRIRLLKASRIASRCLGIDEPFRGLDANEISRVIYRLQELGKTLYVVDHADGIEGFFAKTVELCVKDGVVCESRK